MVVSEALSGDNVKKLCIILQNAIYLRISCPIFNNFTFTKGLSIDLYEYPKYAKINAI